MKRGFLNTEKAKTKLATKSEVPDDHFVHKDKGKARAADIPAHASVSEFHVLPHLDLHSVPFSIKLLLNHLKCKERFIFRHWPRDPNGKLILPSDIRGKQAGNGLPLWGATLYDFYYVRRMPSIDYYATISTGSKLANIMKASGEIEHAQDEISWADHEANPTEILPWDPALAIMAHERLVHGGFGITGKENKKSFTVPQAATAELGSDGQVADGSESQAIEPRKDAVEEAEIPASEGSANGPSGKPADSMDQCRLQEGRSKLPMESPFYPSHYPPPWPLVPFESPYPPFTLQRGIPIHLLPRKLHVHDPWKVTNTDSSTSHISHKEKSWTSMTDRVCTYTLNLPRESEKVDASKAGVSDKDEALDVPETILILPQETEGPTEQPAIRAFLPKRPRKPVDVPEAHLYLSPKGKLGTGNHSVVYEAELELPRDVFCDSTYCKSCLDEQIKVEVDRLKASGEWERRMNEVVKTFEITEPRDTPSSSSDQIPSRHVGFVKMRLEHAPIQTVNISVATTDGASAIAPAQRFVHAPDSVINRHVEYEGLAISIHPDVQWQNPSFPDTICKHQVGKMKPVPRTAKFIVAAKLSLPYDTHLKREASNYAKFPAHFFQHWSGYNILPPIRDPIPIDALVPQFFGYYTPGAQYRSDKFFSPILLLEHCGKPVCASELLTDERHECSALLSRFHFAGWHHGSFAERNILMQDRHPVCSPLEEGEQREISHRHRRYSFRLVDFGRSEEHLNEEDTCAELKSGRELFGLL